MNEEGVKIYKIKYTLNLLPSISEDKDSLMTALGETNELKILSTKVIRDVLEFRWNTYAYKFHYIGLFIHVIYVLVFNIYVSYFMQLPKLEKDESGVARTFLLFFLNIVMGICLIYPMIYDFT
jgi:hypothetical protein